MVPLVVCLYLELAAELGIVHGILILLVCRMQRPAPRLQKAAMVNRNWGGLPAMSFVMSQMCSYDVEGKDAVKTSCCNAKIVEEWLEFMGQL